MRDDKKSQFFIRHMMDLGNRAWQGSYPVFTDFLTTTEYSLLQSIHPRLPGVTVAYWGGNADCDHVVGGFFPADWADMGHEAFPIVCIRIAPANSRYAQNLGHRDYLGAVLNLGLERSKLGDIRICDRTAYVFCKEEFASLIAENLSAVGHTQVACEILRSSADIPAQQYTERECSVASVRLDNIVAAMTGLSRGRAAELIRQGHVVAGHEQRESASFHCRDGTVVTIRGHGKFRLHVWADEFTRKGKQKVTIYKYM